MSVDERAVIDSFIRGGVAGYPRKNTCVDDLLKINIGGGRFLSRGMDKLRFCQ